MATPRTATATRRKTQPVRSTRNTRDTRDADNFGKDKPRAMKSTGPALESLERPAIVQVDGPRTKNKFEAEKFNQDVLTVMVPQTTDVTEEPIPYIIVNGVRQNFIRGMEQQVKRLYVEAFIRRKLTSYTQQKTQDAAGNETYLNIPHTVVAQHIAIIHDPAGQKGRDWYDKIIHEA